MPSDGKLGIDFSTVFASNIHDIKNLLFNLLGTLDQAILDSGGGADQQWMSQLRFNGQRINDKLVQLLAIYRIDSARYELDIEYRSIIEFFQDQLAETRPLAEARGITLEADIAQDIQWVFDRDLVGSAISSALHNALSYAQRRISLSARMDEAGFLVLSVSDDGNGYPQEMLSLNGAASGQIDFKSGRTGLGILFCATVAAAHHNKETRGRIQIGNGGPLCGANFELWLP
jgi:signal transduction histidine kinase